MRTQNSINLLMPHGDCWAKLRGACSAMRKLEDKVCGTHECPYYKPKGCEDWIRVEDKQGINLIPPEEYYEARKVKPKLPEKAEKWVICLRRA